MIVVFGSINLDIVTHVPKIPAPGETVLGSSYARFPGGKGANQALAARRAGATVSLVGATGLDEFADAALSLLRADGVDVTGVAQSPLPTGAAFISIDAGGQNAITVASGANGTVHGAQIDTTGLKAGDILLLQREVPDAEAAIAARKAKAIGAKVILNLAPSGVVPDSYLADVDILVMNEHEADDLARGLGVDGGQAALAGHLRERFGTVAIITLGDQGAVSWDGGVETRKPAPTVTVVDTTAAGDTFTGALAAAIDAGHPLGEALQRGLVAGSLACTKHGAQPSISNGAGHRCVRCEGCVLIGTAVLGPASVVQHQSNGP